MAGKVFVFDLDDTLIDNVHDYSEPILDTCRLIVRMLGRKAPHVDAIIALGHEIESRRVKEINPNTGKPYLYSMERFPGSMVEVYREIAKRAGVVPDPELEKAFYEIGMQAFDESRYAKNIVPNAKKVFDFLQSKGDHCELLTQGDARVQKKKIAVLRSAGLSFHAEVVGDKNVDSFLKVLYRVTQPYQDEDPQNLCPSRFFSVGNSYRSDIEPALDAGLIGIFIPVETWDLIGQMDDMVTEARKKGVLVFNDLADIITHYEEL